MVDQFREGITEGVDAFLCYTRYNTRMVVEITDSKHDQLRLKDMRVIVDVLLKVMDLEEYGNRSCSVLQVKIWYTLVMGEKKYEANLVKEEDVLISNDLPLKRTQF